MVNPNTLRVFIASPSDLEEERSLLRKVVTRLNSTICRTVGMYIDLVGWEELSAGYGRPQESINQFAENCDLFIGVLWKRWGTPTGGYSSGFEEEYKNALERRKKTGAPEIWLYFKDIPDDRIKDPGEQLKQVLAFKQTLVTENTLRFKGFSDAHEWENEMTSSLGDYIVKLAMVSREGATVSTLPPVSSEPISSDTPAQVKAEIQSALQSLQKNIENSQREVSEIEINRLSLFSSARLSTIVGGIDFDAHRSNAVYKYRKQMNVLEIERTFLVHSFLKNYNHRNIPGMFWFGKEDFCERLLILAYSDPDDAIRNVCITLLSLCPTIQFIPQEINFLTKEQVIDNKRAWLQLFKSRKNPADVKYVESFLEDDQKEIKDEANSIKLILEIIQNSDTSVENLSKDNSRVVTASTLRILDEKADEISEKSVRGLLTSNYPLLISWAVKRLSGKLTEIELTNLLSSEHADIAKSATVELGKIRTDDNEIFQSKYLRPEPLAFLAKRDTPDLHAVLETRSKELLAKLIEDELTTELGVQAYYIWGKKYFDEVSSEIITDLQEDFASKYDSHVNRYIERHYTSLENVLQQYEKLNQQYDKLNLDRETSELLEKLKGIKKQKEDFLTMMEKYRKLAVNGLKESALKVLIQKATPEHLPYAYTLINNEDDDVSLLSLELILKTEKDPIALKKLIPIVFEKKSASIAKLLAQYLAQRGIDAEKELRSYLCDEHINIRTAALSYYVLALNRQDLEKLLDEYVNGEKVYYNVCFWLDQIVYCPDDIHAGMKSKFFDEELRNSLVVRL